VYKSVMPGLRAPQFVGCREGPVHSSYGRGQVERRRGRDALAFLEKNRDEGESNIVEDHRRSFREYWSANQECSALC
jgi:hypothetical protein